MDGLSIIPKERKSFMTTIIASYPKKELNQLKIQHGILWDGTKWDFPDKFKDLFQQNLPTNFSHNFRNIFFRFWN